MNFSSENSFAFKRFLKDQEAFIEKLLTPMEYSNVDQRFEIGKKTRLAILFESNFHSVKRDLKTELMNSLIEISKKHGLVEHVNRAYYM